MLWSGTAHGNEQIYPLAPTDTSSPRATLTSFIDNIEEAFRRFQRGEQYPSRRKWHQGVLQSIDKTLQCLDLSQVAPALVRDKGVESAVFLKEVLDRIDLPPYIEIPDVQSAEAKDLTKWTIPHTEITIAKLLNGPRQGEFLFTPQTVQRAREFYRRVEHLPYKKGATKGLLQNYLYSPGYLIPWEWIAALPAWTKRPFLDQTVWQWIGLSLLVLVGGVLFLLIFRWGRRWDKAQPEGRIWRRFGRLFAAVAGFIIPYAINLSLADQLGITGAVRRVVSSIMEIAIFISFAWLVVLLLERVAQAVIRANSTRLSTLDKQVVRIVFRIVSFSVVFYMLLKISEHFGMPLTPLLAGLGVGGVAVALAARGTIENIIGGFILG